LFAGVDARIEMNRWNIPVWLERKVIERDRQCVYCGVEFDGQNANRCYRPSWEHIIRENLQILCPLYDGSIACKALDRFLGDR
jgi:hypothetical protein